MSGTIESVVRILDDYLDAIMARPGMYGKTHEIIEALVWTILHIRFDVMGIPDTPQENVVRLEFDKLCTQHRVGNLGLSSLPEAEYLGAIREIVKIRERYPVKCATNAPSDTGARILQLTQMVEEYTPRCTMCERPVQGIPPYYVARSFVATCQRCADSLVVGSDAPSDPIKSLHT